MAIAAPYHENASDPWNSSPPISKKSVYEQSRETRIKENIIRMEKLGIFDISLKLKSSTTHPKSRTKSIFEHSTPKRSPSSTFEPSRRSSRLRNVTPIKYSDQIQISKRERRAPREYRAVYLEEGCKPEIYTKEHEKLLGSTDKVWPLFVDGCGKDGRRIYDSATGKTCHQCRQKTLGHRTHCIQCNMVQGQFCGDCLFMRYGEHILEAKQNPEWKCPVCRGICNCSLCRQAKGWAPTGQLYRKVLNLGFKSVAHYLIQTRQEDVTSENVVRRSLPFLNPEGDMEKPLSISGVKEEAPLCIDVKILYVDDSGISYPPPVAALKKEMESSAIVAADSIAGRLKRRRENQ